MQFEERIPHLLATRSDANNHNTGASRYVIEWGIYYVYPLASMSGRINDQSVRFFYLSL